MIALNNCNLNSLRFKTFPFLYLKILILSILLFLLSISSTTVLCCSSTTHITRSNIRSQSFSAKSSSIYAAYGKIQKAVKKSGSLPVPFHIRNAPTRLMKDMGYGKDYKYAHNYKEAFVAQEYLPEKLKGQLFYEPTGRGYEKVIKQRLDGWRRLQGKPERTDKNSELK